MHRRSRHVDFSWPVAPADLDAIEVLEAIGSRTGPPHWRAQHPLAEARLATWPATALVDLPLAPDTFDIADVSAASPSRTDAPMPPTLAARRREVPPSLERIGLVAVGLLVGAALATIGLPANPRPAAPHPLPSASGIAEAAAPRDPRGEPAPVPPAPGTHEPLHQVPTDGVVRPARRERAEVASARAGTPGSGSPTASAPVRAPARAADDTTPAVLDAIRRYAVAYSRMDAKATREVWRGIDRQHLVAVFSGLREQRLTLRDCVVHSADDAATATCRGTLRYRPRVGEHSTRMRTGNWRFLMQRAANGWMIESILAP